MLLTSAVDLHGFIEEHFCYQIIGYPKNNLAASQILEMIMHQFQKMINITKPLLLIQYQNTGNKKKNLEIA
jgi:hypothetical protein